MGWTDEHWLSHGVSIEQLHCSLSSSSAAGISKRGSVCLSSLWPPPVTASVLSGSAAYRAFAMIVGTAGRFCLSTAVVGLCQRLSESCSAECVREVIRSLSTRPLRNTPQISSRAAGRTCSHQRPTQLWPWLLPYRCSAYPVYGLRRRRVKLRPRTRTPGSTLR